MKELQEVGLSGTMCNAEREERETLNRMGRELEGDFIR